MVVGLVACSSFFVFKGFQPQTHLRTTLHSRSFFVLKSGSINIYLLFLLFHFMVKTHGLQSFRDQHCLFGSYLVFIGTKVGVNSAGARRGDFRGFYYKNIYISTNLKQKSPGRAEKVVVHLHHLHPLVRRHCLYLLFEITLLLCTHFWPQV